MQIEFTPKLKAEIQAYAYACENNYTFDEACLWLLKTELAKWRSKVVSEAIPLA